MKKFRQNVYVGDTVCVTLPSKKSFISKITEIVPRLGRVNNIDFYISELNIIPIFQN